MSRKLITEQLQAAATRYWADKMYSCHKEVGILPWGGRRVDLFAFTVRLDTVVCEIKSGAADFDADRKFEEYLPFCSAFYFVISQEYWDSDACDRLREAAKRVGAGVLVLPTGNRRLVSMMRVTKRVQPPSQSLKAVIVKLAWRLGHTKYSKR